jgi:hypothetical protein
MRPAGSEERPDRAAARVWRVSVRVGESLTHGRQIGGPVEEEDES